MSSIFFFIVFILFTIFSLCDFEVTFIVFAVTWFDELQAMNDMQRISETAAFERTFMILLPL
jgi:uncharacterized membrane protein YsdA (DUF1294 family)